MGVTADQMMDTGIRRAAIADVPPLVELSRRTISANYRPFLGDQAVDAFIDTGQVDRFVEENIDRCWVILVGDQIAGYSISTGRMIDVVMIGQGFHRRGLGAVLLRHMEETLFREEDDLILESFERNEGANEFYRKNGWTEGRTYHDVGSGVNKVVFHKMA